MKIQISLSSQIELSMQHLFADAYYKMTGPQVRSLTKGLKGFDLWFASNWTRPMRGAMLASNSASEFTLTMNAMRWLTKYYMKDVVSGLPTALRRVHSIKDGPPPALGESLYIKPHKPILSWSTLKDFKILGRGDPEEDGRRDILVEAKIPSNSIVWSYKSKTYSSGETDAISNGFELLCDDLYRKSGKHVDKMKDDKFYDVEEFHNALEEAVSRGNEDESEVIVYHGQEAFNVKVVKVYPSLWDKEERL